MKFWTYKEAEDKIIEDLDLQDQIFIARSEMIGYVNEGIESAEAQILKLNEDYFLKKYPIPVVQGQAEYEYPSDIWGTKIRGIMYINQTLRYSVRRFREKDKFACIAEAELYPNAAQDYMYYQLNPEAGQGKVVFVPAPYETAIVPPNANTFTPFLMWYIRTAKRIPLVGEFIVNYEQILPAAVDIGTDAIAVSKTFVTGDKVRFYSTGTVPGGLVSGTTYYAIASAGSLKLATTLLNAKTGTAIDLTSQGTGILQIQIAATTSIIDNTIIDIPQYIRYVMQFAKCRCFEKEGDPRLAGAAITLKSLEKEMVDSLTQAVPDNDDTIEADFSIYLEMCNRGYF